MISYTVVIDRPTRDGFKFDCDTLGNAKKEAKECLSQEGVGTYAKIITDNGVIARYKKTPSKIANLHIVE